MKGLFLFLYAMLAFSCGYFYREVFVNRQSWSDQSGNHSTRTEQHIMEENKNNAFADPTLWSPEIDKKTGEIKDGEIEGVYQGFSPFEFKEGETTFCLVIDTGNEEFFAMPDWFKIRQLTAMNPERFTEGKTIVKIVFHGKEEIDNGHTQAIFDFYADGVKLGKPLLTLAQLKALHAAQQPKEITQ